MGGNAYLYVYGWAGARSEEGDVPVGSMGRRGGSVLEAGGEAGG